MGIERTMVVHSWDCQQENLLHVVFSDSGKLRFDPVICAYTLRKSAAGYPTDDNLTITFPLWSPKAVREWRALRLEGETPKNSLNEQSTGISLRLKDSSGSYWWDGSTWASATTNSHWSSVAQVEENIHSFPVTNRSLAPVVRLRTTDASVTPRLDAVNVLAGLLIHSSIEDLVYRSVIRELRRDLTFSFEQAFSWPEDGDEADISFLWTGTKSPNGEDADQGSQGPLFNVALVNSIFDNDNDPEHTVDLLDAYSSGVVTLTGSLDAETSASAYIEVRPQVALSTSIDYDENPSVPAAIIRYAQLERTMSSGCSEVFRISGSSGISLRAPETVDVKVPIDLATASSVQCVRLADSIEKYYRRKRVVHSEAFDLEMTILVDAEIGYYPRPDEDQIVRATLTFVVKDVPRWAYESEAANLVTVFNAVIEPL